MICVEWLVLASILVIALVSLVRVKDLASKLKDVEKTVDELNNERILRRLEKSKPTIDPEALENAIKQLHRRLNALTDVVDEVRNGTFTMQWEKREED